MAGFGALARRSVVMACHFHRRSLRPVNLIRGPGAQSIVACSHSKGFSGGLKGSGETRRGPSNSTAAATLSSRRRPRICILGGGFGGLYTALRLDALLWGPQGPRPAITLVDQADRFVFKPLLYELVSAAAAEDDVAPQYSSLLAETSVQFIQDGVSKVEEADSGVGNESMGRVTLQNGGTLEYDWLVVALGAVPILSKAKGAEKHALGFSNLQDARRLTAALKALQEAASSPAGAPGPVVTVVGAGYAGVELAALVADELNGTGASVQLLSPSGELMPGQPAGLISSASRQLKRVGVTIRTGKLLEVSSSGPADPRCADLGKTIVLDNGQGGKVHERSDLVLWTAGNAPVTSTGSPSAFPFPKNGGGMLATDATLRVIDHSHVFAIGDMAKADVPNGQLPNTAQAAMQQADYVAWNLWASINNKPLLPFKYQHLGTMITLGADIGAVSLPLPLPSDLRTSIRGSPVGPLLEATGFRLGDDDRGVTLDGPLAAALRRAAYVWRQPTARQQLKAGTSWVSKSLQHMQESLQRR